MIIEERPHARISPSGFARVEACTKSVVLTKDAPPIAAGIDAATGTAAHAVFEQCLREDLDIYEVQTGLAQVDGYEVEVNESMLEGVRLGLDWVRENMTPPYIVEQRLAVPYSAEYLGEEMWGYVDVAAMEPMPTVVDYKNGHFGVAPDAPQLLLYLISLLADRGLTQGPEAEIAGRTVVVQPNAGGVAVAEHTWGDLSVFINRVTSTFSRIRRGEFTFAHGEHCRFCSAASYCPHLAAVARDAALVRVTPDPEMVARGEFDADRLNEAMNLIPVIDAWCRAVSRTAEDYLINGGRLRDWKLARKKTNRRWRDPEPEVEAALSGLGIDPWQRTIVSPAEAERRLPKARRAAVAELAEKPAGELTVTHVSDRRPGVEVALTLRRALESSVAAGFLAGAQARAPVQSARQATGETQKGEQT